MKWIKVLEIPLFVLLSRVLCTDDDDEDDDNNSIVCRLDPFVE